MYSTCEKEVEEDEAGQWQGRRRVSPSPVFPAAEANVGAHVLERAVLLYRAFAAFNPPILPLVW